jgi:hypothetical protein
MMLFFWISYILVYTASCTLHHLPLINMDHSSTHIPGFKEQLPFITTDVIIPIESNPRKDFERRVGSVYNNKNNATSFYFKVVDDDTVAVPDFDHPDSKSWLIPAWAVYPISANLNNDCFMKCIFLHWHHMNDGCAKDFFLNDLTKSDRDQFPMMHAIHSIYKIHLSAAETKAPDFQKLVVGLKRYVVGLNPRRPASSNSFEFGFDAAEGVELFYKYLHHEISSQNYGHYPRCDPTGQRCYGCTGRVIKLSEFQCPTCATILTPTVSAFNLPTDFPSGASDCLFYGMQVPYGVIEACSLEMPTYEQSLSESFPALAWLVDLDTLSIMYKVYTFVIVYNMLLLIQLFFF